MKNEIAQKHLKFYNIDGVKIAREAGLGGRINMASRLRSSRSPRAPEKGSCRIHEGRREKTLWQGRATDIVVT